MGVSVVALPTKKGHLTKAISRQVSVITHHSEYSSSTAVTTTAVAIDFVPMFCGCVSPGNLEVQQPVLTVNHRKRVANDLQHHGHGI